MVRAAVVVSRRSMLLAAAGAGVGALALPGGPAASAEVDPYALAPDWRTGWKVHKTLSAAKVVQRTGGVRIDTPSNASQADAGQVALWAKQPVAGDFECTFTYKVVSRLAVQGGAFGTFYFDTLGEGSAAYPLAVPDWTGVTPSDTVYATHARGLRFSFATYNPGAPDVHKRLRLRAFDFAGSAALVEPASPQSFPFDTGKAYAVKVRRQGDILAVTVTPKAGGTARSFSWTDSRIGSWGGGHVGFRWRAQDCEVTNLALAPLLTV